VGRLGLASVLLEAVKLAFVDDIEVITIAALENNIISRPKKLGKLLLVQLGLLEFHLLHGVDDDLGFLLVESREHEGLVHSLLDPFLLLLSFVNNPGLIISLLVVLSINLSTNSLTLLALNWSGIFIEIIIIIRFIGLWDPVLLLGFALFMRFFLELTSEENTKGKIPPAL